MNQRTRAPSREWLLRRHRRTVILAAAVMLATGSELSLVACRGSAPLPSLPPPEYERPVLPPWQSDAGASSNLEQGVAEAPTGNAGNGLDAGG